MNQPPIGIILVSHGHFCEETIHTINMIYGPVEDLMALPLTVGQDPDDYCAQLDQLIRKYNGNVLILIDLMGGTPFNSVMKLGKQWNLAAITGVNIPMVINAIDLRKEADTLQNIAEGITEDSRTSILNITPQLSDFYQKYAKSDSKA